MKQLFKKSIYTVIVSLFLNCNAAAFLNEIKTPEAFKTLESLPLSKQYTNVGSVKVIYDLKSEQIYFTNSKVYKFHYEFCNLFLGYENSVSQFNEDNYNQNDNRQFCLATINHYRDLDLYSFEFSSSEEYSSENIAFYRKVQKLIFCNEQLRLFPGSASQISYIEEKYPEIEIIKADQIYKGLQLQLLNEGTAIGKLKYINIDSFDTEKIEKNDIVIINGTPNEIPLCRAIICTNFQAPLSHIVLLSHNRSTPIIAYKNAWKDENLRELENKIVKFIVNENHYDISTATEKEAESFWKKTKHNSLKKLHYNEEKKGLIALKTLNYKMVDIVGGKAANFGELNRVYVNSETKIQIPKASFAIPFYYYLQHINKAGIDTLIANLNNENLQTDNKLLEQKLYEIRTVIKSTPINSSFLTMVTSRATKGGISRLRFRSSTNAEDIKGFNGAGLYDSKTGILGDSTKTIEKAIKKVWASLWNLRAYQERAYYNIDQQSIAMGILVHESFPEEKINGVAITKNIYRAERTGITINIQQGETSVVNPPADVLSEQIVCKQAMENNKDTEIEYISYSSLHPQNSMLSIVQTKELYEILKAVKLHFYSLQNKMSRKIYSEFALDIEFKILKDNTIIIKQARIY